LRASWGEGDGDELEMAEGIMFGRRPILLKVLGDLKKFYS